MCVCVCIYIYRNTYIYIFIYNFGCYDEMSIKIYIYGKMIMFLSL